MDMKQAIERVVARQNLSGAEMTAIMHRIMSGNATAAQIGGFLVGLRLKGETVEEITAAAAVMRELASGVELTDLSHVVDVVGTGGDGAATFNVSTASIFVAAAAGCNVAKHGNRSVSSSSGSADVLEAAGVRLDLSPAQVERCVREIGIGFMFAPAHHGAMRHAIGPRRELGIRTLFNILGPLTNPARAPNQVIGVFSQELLLPMAEVLQRLGSNHALVVYGQDKLDEISIGAKTDVAELRKGKIYLYQIDPENYNIRRAPNTELKVTGPEASLAIIRAVLEYQPGPARDMVTLNAGAAIYAADLAESLADGYAKADASIRSGKAKEKFNQLIKFTQSLANLS